MSFNVCRRPMMLHPKAAPPVLRQIEQKQNMKGTGVSESTVNCTLPHWHDPARGVRCLRIRLAIRELCRASAGGQPDDRQRRG